MPPRLHVPYTVPDCFVAFVLCERNVALSAKIALILDAIVEENSNAIFYFFFPSQSN
jgi:hypothetical protein